MLAFLEKCILSSSFIFWKSFPKKTSHSEFLQKTVFQLCLTMFPLCFHCVSTGFPLCFHCVSVFLCLTVFDCHSESFAKNCVSVKHSETQ